MFALTGTLLTTFNYFRSLTPTAKQNAHELKRDEIDQQRVKSLSDICNKQGDNYTTRRDDFLKNNGLPKDYTLRPSGRKSAFNRN